MYHWIILVCDQLKHMQGLAMILAVTIMLPLIALLIEVMALRRQVARGIRLLEYLTVKGKRVLCIRR
jgi:hypothetical protein